MRKLFVTFTVCGLALWLAIPASAQRSHGGGLGLSAHGSSNTAIGARGLGSGADISSSARMGAAARANKGGHVRGLGRAEAVQSSNTRADVNRGFTVAPGVEAAEKHQASGEAGEQAATHHMKNTKHQKKHDKNHDESSETSPDRDNQKGSH